MRRLAFLIAALLAAPPAMAAPKVIASVLPVYGMVAAVMGDLGQPELLLQGKLSEHRASFSPAQVAELGRADLVFIVGQGLEAKLAQMSGSEAVKGQIFIALSQAAGVAKLPIREGGGFEHHDHAEADHEEEGHTEGILAFDPHVWLDPDNAKAMAAEIAARLSEADPGNAAAYATNARAFAATVDETAADIARELAPVRQKPYVVFHDAYQYFESHFGLAAVGSIADVSAQPPSARRLAEIRAKIATTNAVCVFREPQYDDKVVATVIEGSTASAGVLDPLGATVAPGPAAYQELLRNLAKSLSDCLDG